MLRENASFVVGNILVYRFGWPTRQPSHPGEENNTASTQPSTPSFLPQLCPSNVFSNVEKVCGWGGGGLINNELDTIFKI